MKASYNTLTIRSLLLGAILNLVMPFTYINGGIFTKKIFSVGNPVLIIPYALLVFIALLSVSKKDIENRERYLVLDIPREIPKTILRSILEIVFAIIFMFIVPFAGGLVLVWNFGVRAEIAVFICIGYIAILVFLGKKYYWKHKKV